MTPFDTPDPPDEADDSTWDDHEPFADNDGDDESLTLGPDDDDQSMEASEPLEYGMLVNAALGSMHDDERDSLKRKIASFVALHPDHTEQLDTRNWDRLDDDVKAAASAIWNEAAAIVGKAVTEQHLDEYREDLVVWRRDPFRETASEEDVRIRYPFLAWAWDAMKELARHFLEEAVQATVIEMLFPGAHLIIPPMNLVAALFTAGDLADVAQGIA
ncbi:hypothetical protein [Dactylosporangium sp. CA-092794]|uniref:hypothetical protein n=1 Tax=Dactylosporangium sp. CA-092794 TaxID=3239929 RepID=UPI003D90C15B